MHKQRNQIEEKLPQFQKRNNSNIKETLRGYSWIYMKEAEKFGFSDHLVELESVSV